MDYENTRKGIELLTRHLKYRDSESKQLGVTLKLHEDKLYHTDKAGMVILKHDYVPVTDPMIEQPIYICTKAQINKFFKGGKPETRKVEGYPNIKEFRDRVDPSYHKNKQTLRVNAKEFIDFCLPRLMDIDECHNPKMTIKFEPKKTKYGITLIDNSGEKTKKTDVSKFFEIVVNKDWSHVFGLVKFLYVLYPFYKEHPTIKFASNTLDGDMRTNGHLPLRVDYENEFGYLMPVLE